MIRVRLKSIKTYLPDLLSLGALVGLPGWIGPAWKGYHASRRLIAGEEPPSIEELQARINELDIKVQELEKRLNNHSFDN